MDSAHTSVGDQGPFRVGTKRGRGPTRCLELYRLPEGQKLTIIDDDMGLPVGENATKLQNFCGTLARDGRLFPLDLPSWRHVDDTMRERAWNTIKSVGKKWRDYKSDLKKKHYDPYFDDETRYEHRPDNVLDEQWHSLIDFWNFEEGRKRSEKNKASRSRQKMSHTSGTKSFARVRHEHKEKSSSHTPPSRAEIFIKTHSHKDGTPVDTATSEIERMKKLMANILDGSQDSTSRHDIFSQVMGPERHGRVRCCGLGPTPTSLWGSSSCHSGTYNRDDELSKLKDQVKSMQERDAERDIEINELRSMIHHLSRQVIGHSSDPQTPIDRVSQSLEGNSSAHISDMDPSPHQRT